MSHEGIRIVRGTEAPAKGMVDEPLTAAAMTPIKVRVKQTEGTGVEIAWADGHQSSWTFPWLRLACPCATCHEEREKTGLAPGEAKPRSQALLALYEAPARPVEVNPVGKYALKFKWNDGHESGIYSWEYLRRVCRCPECMEKARLA